MQWALPLSQQKGMVKVTSRSGQVRESGKTAAVEEAALAGEALTEPINVELPEETRTRFRTPGFSRMRMEWRSEDRPVIAGARAAVEGALLRNFKDAFLAINDVYDLVRTPAIDPATGEIRVDQWNFTVWKRTPSGSFEEDWTRLTLKAKETLLFKITTALFAWQQQAADAWGEAMFAKAQWEERYAIAYDAPMSGTIEDRNAAANIDARDERYFAIFTSWYSKKADALVRSLELLSQRIKDSMQT
jgi:hypothetical protein